jgi:hypothetical protein
MHLESPICNMLHTNVGVRMSSPRLLNVPAVNAQCEQRFKDAIDWQDSISGE